MTVPEVLFTTWVGWPLYAGFTVLLGAAAWERWGMKR